MSSPELRVPRAEDAAAWCALFDDPAVMRFIGSGEVRDLQYYTDLVARQQELAATSGLCLWSVVVDGQVVGFAGIHPWGQAWGPGGALEAGWRISRRFWGRGHATAAAAAAVDRARERDVPRLVSMIQVGNAASEAVARKIGMVTTRLHHSPDGVPVQEFGLTLR